MKTKVFCHRCVHLLLAKRKVVLPLCVGTAEWIPGPLRERINVKGVVQAEVRNVNNDCEYFRLFPSRNSREIKAWMMRSIYAETGKLSEYEVEEEEGKKETLLKKGFSQTDYPEREDGPSEPSNISEGYAETEDAGGNEDSEGGHLRVESGAVVDDGKSGSSSESAENGDSREDNRRASSDIQSGDVDDSSEERSV